MMSHTVGFTTRAWDDGGRSRRHTPGCTCIEASSRWVELDQPTGCSTTCVNTGRELSSYLLHPLYRTEEMLGQGASILHEIDLIVPFEVVGPCFLGKAASATGLGRHFKKSIAPTYGPCFDAPPVH
jgi:hypothetical protein